MSVIFQQYTQFASPFEEELFTIGLELNIIHEKFEIYLIKCLNKELERIAFNTSCSLYIGTELFLGIPEKNLSQVTPEELDIWICLFLNNMTNSLLRFIKYPYDDTFKIPSDEEILEEMKKYTNLFHRNSERTIYNPIESITDVNYLFDEYVKSIYFGSKHIYIKEKLKEQCKLYYDYNGIK